MAGKLPTSSSNAAENATAAREELLAHLKKEVKQVMEEAVMKRFIYEDGGTVTSLCVSIENCLTHGLKKRIFGLFGTTSTFGLLHKIAPLCPPAASIVKMVVQIQQKYIKMQKSSSFDKKGDTLSGSSSKTLPSSFRYLWIRLALFEKVLSVIVEFISKSGSKFYEPYALMSDPMASCTVAALLVGPCAVEYSKMKTLDHYWTDPPADELIQRHRIHSRCARYGSPVAQSPRSPRPTLQVKRTESLGPDDMTQKLSSSAREYVISLHQNAKSSLLYGKNGVTVWPVGAPQPMKGYLSLHQNVNSALTIKWTPNDLMHCGSDPSQPADRTYWRYAIKIDVNDIVYLHCHQQGDTGGSIVLIGADGIQHPPIQFPTGQHPLAFLSCLENGMLPWGQLDPPLWLQKGKGKVFPKVKRRSSVSNGKLDNNVDPSNECDYVFRVIPAARALQSDELSLSGPSAPLKQAAQSRLISLANFSARFKERLLSLNSSPISTPPMTPKSRSSSQHSIEQSPQMPRRNGFLGSEESSSQVSINEQPAFVSQLSAPGCLEASSPKSPSRMKLLSACDSMRYQILSRAFYGWLAHCRHLKTVRTRLVSLINETAVPLEESTAAVDGLTQEMWEKIRYSTRKEDEMDFYRHVYYGNMPHSLRRDVWPVLLGFYSWGMSENEREEHYSNSHDKYEGLLTEWTSVEAIVRERDKEAFKAARESNESQTSAESAMPMKQASTCSDLVFESSDESEPVAPNMEPDVDAKSVGALTMDSLGDVCTVHVSESMTRSQHSSSGNDNNISMDEKRHKRCNADGHQDKSALHVEFGTVSPGRSTPEEGDGGLFSKELIDLFAMNLHRIEKDVHRCDRNYPYFTATNLEKLKNVMCTFVWENLHAGYVQGMCDLAAPLLVVFDDEVLTYGCFSLQMKRMAANFPHGGGMDVHLANMRALLQIFDPELFDLMHQNGDYTHFYFSYRWFLLDFKRELMYKDVFRVWEIIWAAIHVSSNSFIVFLAVAMVQMYRDIILDNNMDFTDVIKFFNEMAEKHDANALLELARNLVQRLQKAIEK